MKDYNEVLTAGISAPFHGVGTFFRLLSTVAPVDIIFYKGGAEVSRASQMEAGFAEEMGPGEVFDSLRIVSAVNQTVKWSVRNRGRVHYDRMVGQMSVDNFPSKIAGFVNTQKTVTTASAELVPVNLDRKYLVIQNKHASGSIYFSVGIAATVANGFRLEAGDAFEFPFIPDDIIYAIGDAISNDAICVMEAE